MLSLKKLSPSGKQDKLVGVGGTGVFNPPVIKTLVLFAIFTRAIHIFMLTFSISRNIIDDKMRADYKNTKHGDKITAVYRLFGEINHNIKK
jgi:hypothetical protein